MPRFSGIRIKGKGFRTRVKTLTSTILVPSRNIKSENASLRLTSVAQKIGSGSTSLAINLDSLFFTISWVYCYFLDIATLNKCELLMIHKYEYALNASS